MSQPTRFFSNSFTRLQVLSFLIPVLACSLYVLFTNQIWEDFFITFKASKNLADGNGLVYHLGEKVHTFTSPLNVLLPALFYYLLPDYDYAPAIGFYRIFSALCLAVGFGAVARFFYQDLKFKSWLIYTFLFVASFEVKTVAFATNGMETGHLLLFLCLAFVAMAKGIDKHWKLAGVSWAGLMWSRPDACIYIATISFASLLFIKTERKVQLYGIFKAAVITTCLYLPWFLFAYGYYGSPVPNTVLAKAGSDYTILFSGKFSLWQLFGIWLETLSSILGPVYYFSGHWGIVYRFLLCSLGFASAFYWVVPSAKPYARIASFCVFVGSLYAWYLDLVYICFPWYLPPIGLLSAIVLVAIISQLSQMMLTRNVIRYPRLLVMGALLGVVSFTFVMMSATYRLQQLVIEWGTRYEIGLWLEEHVSGKERVYLEPIGYIGYFSGANIRDFPGLVAPEIVELRQKKALNFGEIIFETQPEWLVLRDYRAQPILRAESGYELVMAFDNRAVIDSYKDVLPNLNTVRTDACFLIFKKIAPSSDES